AIGRRSGFLLHQEVPDLAALPQQSAAEDHIPELRLGLLDTRDFAVHPFTVNMTAEIRLLFAQCLPFPRRFTFCHVSGIATRRWRRASISSSASRIALWFALVACRALRAGARLALLGYRPAHPHCGPVPSRLRCG